jgi:hypothetical protein
MVQYRHPASDLASECRFDDCLIAGRKICGWWRLKQLLSAPRRVNLKAGSQNSEPPTKPVDSYVFASKFF